MCFWWNWVGWWEQLSSFLSLRGSSSDLWGTRAKIHVNNLSVQGHSAVFFQNVTILFACKCQVFIYGLMLLYKHCRYAQCTNF